MGLLDDLQLKVQKLREEEALRHAEINEQEIYYENHLKVVMQRAHRYFEEVIENLNIIKPEIHATYPLDSTAQVPTRLRQADYFFNSDNSRHPRQIDILTHCNLDRQIEFYVPTMEGALNQSELLENYRFPHHRKNKLDKLHNICGATFILEGPIKVSIRITAAPADRCIYILLRNLEEQPNKRYKFSPDKVNDELLDRLARMLIREESKLVEVQVSEDLRSELQRKIEEERRLKEEHLAEAYAEMEAERLQAEEARFVNRTKRAIAKRNQELLSFITKAVKTSRSP